MKHKRRHDSSARYIFPLIAILISSHTIDIATVFVWGWTGTIPTSASERNAAGLIVYAIMVLSMAALGEYFIRRHSVKPQDVSLALITSTVSAFFIIFRNAAEDGVISAKEAEPWYYVLVSVIILVQPIFMVPRSNDLGSNGGLSLIALATSAALFALFFAIAIRQISQVFWPGPVLNCSYCTLAARNAFIASPDTFVLMVVAWTIVTIDPLLYPMRWPFFSKQRSFIWIMWHTVLAGLFGLAYARLIYIPKPDKYWVMNSGASWDVTLFFSFGAPSLILFTAISTQCLKKSVRGATVLVFGLACIYMIITIATLGVGIIRSGATNAHLIWLATSQGAAVALGAISTLFVLNLRFYQPRRIGAETLITH